MIANLRESRTQNPGLAGMKPNLAGGDLIQIQGAPAEPVAIGRARLIAGLDPKATLEAGSPVVGVPGSSGGVYAEAAMACSVWHGSALSKLEVVGLP
jgi:hypothetical protein